MRAFVDMSVQATDPRCLACGKAVHVLLAQRVDPPCQVHHHRIVLKSRCPLFEVEPSFTHLFCTPQVAEKGVVATLTPTMDRARLIRGPASKLAKPLCM